MSFFAQKSCFFDLSAVLCDDFWFLNGVTIMNKVKNFFKRYVLAGLIALAARNGVAANNGTMIMDKSVAATEWNIKKIGAPLTVAQLNENAKIALEKKKYEQCIDFCRRIIITNEKGLYANACYMMGCAYTELGVYDKAIINFQQAKIYYNQYGVYHADNTVDYLGLYDAGLQNAMRAQKYALNNPSKHNRSK